MSRTRHRFRLRDYTRWRNPVALAVARPLRSATAVTMDDAFARGAARLRARGFHREGSIRAINSCDLEFERLPYID